MRKYILGIDIGGTKTIVGLATSTGKLLDTINFPSQAQKGKSFVIKSILKHTALMLKKNKTQKKQVCKIGIGVPGIVSSSEGIVFNPPNLPGWKQVNIKKLFEKEFNIPIFVENDANAAALAESKFGAGKPFKNIIYLTVSTGIGGGIVINKKIHRSKRFSAAEVGHMVIDKNGPTCKCGQKGCLECLASGTALAKQAKKTFKKNMTALQVELLAKKGNKKAQKLINKLAENLGLGLANLENILEPEAFIIGGGLSNMGDMLFAPVRKAAKKYAMSALAKYIKILPARFKEKAGVMGAIALCL